MRLQPTAKKQSWYSTILYTIMYTWSFFLMFELDIRWTAMGVAYAKDVVAGYATCSGRLAFWARDKILGALEAFLD